MKKKFIFFILIFALLILLVVVSYSYSQPILYDETNKTKAESSIYKIEKVVFFSSADAITHPNKRLIWDLDIYQYTNIGIYISTEENIEKIYLNNFSTTNYYTKDYLDFGIGNFLEEQKIQTSIEFLQNPITLSFINEKITENYIIPATDELTFDGSLLKKSHIDLSTIPTEISFDINILTTTQEHFVCNFNTKVSLEETEENSIYNGHLVTTLEYPNFIFVKVN